MRILTLLTLCLAARTLPAQRLDTLPGDIVRYDDYATQEGYYIFYPVIAGDVYSRDSLGIVVFTHGYGGLNPLNYGAWIRHLVEQRQVVIYPRYQRNLLLPRPKAFAKTHHAALTSALAYLDTVGIPVAHTAPIYVGHSYGGTLTAYALAKQDSLGYAPAFGAVLAAPGTNRLKGARLRSYASIDPTTQLIIVSHADDEVVGDEFSRLVFESVADKSQTLWIEQRAQGKGEGKLGASHNECYAIDEAFDSGYRNFTTRRALRVACDDALDRELYWPLVDQMIVARRDGMPHPAFYNYTELLPFGAWEDGSPREELVAHYRGRAPRRSHFLNLSDETRLTLLSEDEDYVPPPKNVKIPYTLEEMLERLSAPAESAGPGGQ